MKKSIDTNNFRGSRPKIQKPKGHEQHLVSEGIDFLRQNHSFEVGLLDELVMKDENLLNTSDLILADYIKFKLFVENTLSTQVLCEKAKIPFGYLWHLGYEKLTSIFKQIECYLLLIPVLQIPFSVLLQYNDAEIRAFIIDIQELRQLSGLGVTWDCFLKIKQSDPEKYILLRNRLANIVDLMSKHGLQWSHIVNTEIKKLKLLLDKSYALTTLRSESNVTWCTMLAYTTEALTDVANNFGVASGLICERRIYLSALVVHPNRLRVFALASEHLCVKPVITISDFAELSVSQRDWIKENHKNIVSFFTRCCKIKLYHFAQLPPPVRDFAFNNPQAFYKLAEYLEYMKDFFELPLSDIQLAFEDPDRFINYCKHIMALEENQRRLLYPCRELFSSLVDGYRQYISEQPGFTAIPICEEKTPLLTEQNKSGVSALTPIQKNLIGGGVGAVLVGGGLWIAFATSALSVSGSAALVTLLTIALPATITVAGLGLVIGVSIYAWNKHISPQVDKVVKPTA